VCVRMDVGLASKTMVYFLLIRRMGGTSQPLTCALCAAWRAAGFLQDVGTRARLTTLIGKSDHEQKIYKRGFLNKTSPHRKHWKRR
jgi:hypothetical protein